MVSKKSNLVPTLMTLLSLVVIAQSAALAWLILRTPDPEQTLVSLRERPVETVVEMCLPTKATLP
ncbi:hypothetical protein GVN24_27570 [Rhizobium sp. CRIBSB]|nr:hypothetical protein [Rhizobium sp. CRIBSB]